MALTSGCKASGSQERNAERRKLGSSCHTLASSFPLPTFFEANSLKINSVRFCTCNNGCEKSGRGNPSSLPAG